MLKHITTALGADRPRVRRGSVPMGHERGFWRPMARQESRRLVLAARRYELATRALGHVAIEVLDYLANLVTYRTGRLEPSYAHLCAMLRRSKDAIARALHRLKAHGFLDWLRRHTPTGFTGKGPQIRQAANAYRLSMPPRAARLLPAPPPLPDIDAPEPVPTEEVRKFRAMADAILSNLGRESARRGGVEAKS